MNRTVIRVAGLIVFLLSSAGAYDRAFVEETIHRTYNLDPAAPEMIQQVIDNNPTHPIGYLMHSSRLYWLDVYTQYDADLEESFLVEAKRALKVAKQYAADHKGDVEAEFFLGMVELSLARYYIDNGRWFHSFLKARPGMKRLTRLLEENPDFHDAKQPIGLANCYFADAPGYLKPLVRLFRTKGDFDYGLRLLEECKESGFIAKYESSMYIADVADELSGDYEKARDEMAELVELFPGNVLFQKELAIFEERTGRVDQAIERFESVSSSPNFGKYLKISFDVYLRLGQAYERKGDPERALANAQKCLDAMDGIEAESAQYLKGWALLLKAMALDSLGEAERAKSVYAQIDRKPNERAYQAAQANLSKIGVGGNG